MTDDGRIKTLEMLERCLINQQQIMEYLRRQDGIHFQHYEALTTAILETNEVIE